MAVQKMSDMIVPIAAISIRVVAKSPPAVSPHFVVRKQELDRMMKHLARSTDTKQKVFAITGMGGSGKTQLVSYFLQEMNGNKELFSHVVFVDARSEASLKTDLQLWAQSLGAGHEADDWNNGLEILATDLNDGSWVLIFDNADDPSLKLKKYFPRCSSGTIVFTSRNWEVGNLANTDHLELEKMSQGDALATLEKAAHRRLMEPSQELESAKTLMDELGCLPLALVHAGTYCHRQSSIIDGQDHLFTFTQYLNLFRKKRAALMNKKGVTTQEDYEHGVYTALDLSYQAINGSSKQFLHIISQFHYSEIPLAMFLEAAKAGFQDPRVFLPRPAEHRNVINQLTTLLCPDGEADEFQLRELIGDLRSFSLVSPSEGSLFLRLHPLVQAWIRDMRPAEPQDYQTMAKQIIISCCLSTNIRIYRYLLPHIEDIIGKDEGVDLHVNDQMALELVYRELGRYDDAETLIEFASNSMREQSDKETEDTLYIEGRLAAIYMHQDLWYQAEELQLSVLERRRIVLSADHPDIIDAASNLAVVYINQERWNEAEPLQLEVLENRQKRLGPLHSRSIDAMTNLAVAYKGQGRLEEAVALEKEAVEMHKQIGTIDMPNGIQAQQNLATMYAKQGKWDEAEKLQMAVLEKQRALLGASHPTSINTAFFLADMYRNEGKWEDAEGIMEIAVTQSIEVMGKLDPRTQFYISILIDVYEELGKLEKAREMEELIVKLE
ncbi:hypothetical protein M408DRAFT_327097 [Serendipita vermifera MAFF 305830]|uniref:NB-ARC domain-containing protein n=1 Tax=Serendipita vermifera MAFF 305830 TaxID=933852 RepID=A0A0C2XRU6_SERVB|nr:hypothetical protein M408DRAFT_327097 [Serendipita vermifera MAFF 305830]